MSLQMTEHEICMMYRDAKDKNEQISILADLNVCDSGTIIDVLARNGFVPGMPKKKPKTKTIKKPERFSVEDMKTIEKLYAEGVLIKEIAERLGHDYIATKNKIIHMGLPAKYGKRKPSVKKPDKPSEPKRSLNNSDADKLYIQTLEETLKEKESQLREVTTCRDAYKIELDKLMDENELLREENKYREDFSGVYNELKDARLIIALIENMADEGCAAEQGLQRASELIGEAMKELL